MDYLPHNSSSSLYFELRTGIVLHLYNIQLCAKNEAIVMGGSGWTDMNRFKAYLVAVQPKSGTENFAHLIT